MPGPVRLVALAMALASCLMAPQPALAESAPLRIASQYGFGFLPLTVMRERGLVETRLAGGPAAGAKVEWLTLGGGNAMNEALLSGSLDIASGGITPFITLWAKTRGNIDVRAIAAMSSLSLWLNTRNPAVASLRDLGEADKIAVTAVKVSVHAILLQMAAEQLWGPAQRTRLDPLTVALSQPDAMAALLSPRSEVNAHFTAPPFQYLEAKQPGIHRIVTSQEILGGPATFIVAWATERFRRDNPALYAAFLAALGDAIQAVNDDPAAAAAIYRKATGEGGSEQEIVEMLRDPATRFTLTPENVMPYVAFMQRAGSVRTAAQSWTELFFPEVHGLPGS